MTTYLVTDCAGFIGTTFAHYMLKRYTDIRIINLDALTYAGNLENLKDLEDDERHIVVHGNICDVALVKSLIDQYGPDYIINFAAESHVDRSIAYSIFANIIVLYPIRSRVKIYLLSRGRICMDMSYNLMMF